MAERYAFDVTWLDPSSKVEWAYVLLHTPYDAGVEIYDPKARRTFLKKTAMPAVKLEHLFVGATVVVLARTLKIVGYADEATRNRLAAQRESVFALVLAVEDSGAILEAVTHAGLVLANAKLARLTPQLAAGLTVSRALPPDVGLASGVCLGMELVGQPDAAAKARAVLRAGSGSGSGTAAVASDTAAASAADVALFFSAQVASAARGAGTTLAVVKPHALASGSGGALLSALQAQFEVTAAAVVCLDRADAASFWEVYKGVVPEYAHAVEELTAGPALALELAPRGGAGESAVQLLRDAAGPADPELGRVLRPASLRARFGVDKVKNALHVTDLEGDAPLEVAFFFGARR